MTPTAQLKSVRYATGDAEQGIDRRPAPIFSGLIESTFGRAGNPQRQAILFMAAEPGAGVSWTASAVAAELSASGRKVLLADAEVIASLDDGNIAVSLCERVGFGRTWILGADQAARARMQVRPGGIKSEAVLYSLLEKFPDIVLDAPALSISDVALRLAPLATGSVFVVRKGRSEKDSLMKAHGLVTSLGGRVLGSVYNAHS